MAKGDSKPNQVQLFFIFFSSGHWAELHQRCYRHQGGVVVISKHGLVIFQSEHLQQKVIFLKWKSLNYCELFVYSYHEAFFFFLFFFFHFLFVCLFVARGKDREYIVYTVGQNSSCLLFISCPHQSPAPAAWSPQSHCDSQLHTPASCLRP